MIQSRIRLNDLVDTMKVRRRNLVSHRGVTSTPGRDGHLMDLCSTSFLWFSACRAPQPLGDFSRGLLSKFEEIAFPAEGFYEFKGLFQSYNSTIFLSLFLTVTLTSELPSFYVLSCYIHFVEVKHKYGLTQRPPRDPTSQILLFISSRWRVERRERERKRKGDRESPKPH